MPRPKIADVVGALSLAGLLAVWAMVLNPLKTPGFVPRGTAVGALTMFALLSFLAGFYGVRAWFVVFAATIPTLVYVLLFYRPLLPY